MPLETSNIPITFRGGLDTKSDSKQTISAKLSTLENGVFTAPGKIQKRNGFARRGQSIEGGGSTSAGRALFTYKGELLLNDATTLYGLVSSTGKWSNKGTGSLPSLVVRTSPVLRSTNQPGSPDGNYHVSSGLSCYAWEDSAGGVYYSLIDAVTGTKIVDRALVLAAGACPKVLALSGLIFIIYTNVASTRVEFKTIDVTTPATLSAATNFTANLSATNPTLDAIVIGTSVYVSWTAFTAGTSRVWIGRIDSTGSILGTLELVAGDAAVGGLALVDSPSAFEIVCVYATATQVKWAVTARSIGSVLSTGTLAAADAGVSNITGIQIGTIISVYWTKGGLVRLGTLTGASGPYAAAGPADIFRGVSLIGKAFAYSSGYYVPVGFTSTLQNSHFIVNAVGSVYAKLVTEAGLAGPVPVAGKPLPEVAAISASKFQIAHLVKESQFAQGGSIASQTGLNGSTFDFADTTYSFSSVELGGALQVSGGCMRMYAGGAPVEHGFHLYPEGLTVATYPFGGALGQGSYAWSACYEWLDPQGIRHRSAPAAVTGTFESVNFSAATTNASPNIYVAIEDADQFLRGMAITGPGIGAAAVINSIDNYSGTLAVIVLSVNSTATASAARLKATVPPYTLTAAVNVSKVVELDSIRWLYAYGTTVAGSPVITMVSSVTGLAVGQQLFTPSAAYPFGGALQVIQSISGQAVTMNANAATTTTTPQLMQFQYQAANTATATPGSPNLTVASATDVAYAASHVGALAVDAAAWPAGTKIVSAAGTTIVMSANSTIGAPGVSQPILYAAGASQLSVGQVLSGTGIPTGTTVAATTVTGGTSTVTMSQFPTTTGTSLTVTTTGMALLVLPTLRLTSRDPTTVQIVTYRTQANGSTSNRVSSVTSPTANSATVDTVTFVDAVPDKTALGSDLLYTTGGVLENIPAPPTLSAVGYRNRIFAIVSTSPHDIAYSKEVVSGAPVEFNDALILTVDPGGSDLVGLGVLDDKLISFQRTAIHYLAGEGPNATGGQNDYGLWTRVATDAGCIEPRSIVQTPNGLMYQSKRGIYLLDRGLNAQSIGAEVEAYNADVIVSAVLVEAYTQVRFTTASARVLVYDYFVGQWSVFTDSAAAAFASAVGSVSFGAAHNVLNSSGRVVYEDPTTKLDNAASFVPLKITTANLSLAGIQGFQRVNGVTLLGSWLSRHDLTVTVYPDFASTTYIKTFSNTATSSPLQLRVQPSVQKCQSVQIGIFDAANGALGTGGGFDLSALILEVGIKKGPFRLPAAQSGAA